MKKTKKRKRGKGSFLLFSPFSIFFSEARDQTEQEEKVRTKEEEYERLKKSNDSNSHVFLVETVFRVGRKLVTYWKLMT